MLIDTKHITNYDMKLLWNLGLFSLLVETGTLAIIASFTALIISCSTSLIFVYVLICWQCFRLRV